MSITNEEDVRLVIQGKKHRSRRNYRYPFSEKPKLVSDLEAKKNTGRGISYDRAITNTITKQQAKALLFFQQHGYSSISDLSRFSENVEETRKQISDLSMSITSAEKRLKEIGVLQTHIINYSKTRNVYTGYKAAGYSKRYYGEHEDEIKTHKASKRYFDEPGLTKLPTVKSLREEYAQLLAQKKEDYAEYYKSKEEYREMLIHRANLAQVLGIDEKNLRKDGTAA